MAITARACFTDSNVVLYWICGVQKSWGPFVQNRVAEIRSLIPVECWRHCPGIENPADIPSRGTSPQELLVNDMWRNGPGIPPPSVWLIEDEGVQPEESMPPDCAAELRASDRPTVGLLTRDSWGITNIIKIGDFNKLSHLLGIVTRVLRFCSNLKKRVNPDYPTKFDSNERKFTETLLIKSAQDSLRKNKNFSQWEKQLRVFTDQDGVMRCQGRIANADTVPYSSKYPILLPSGHHLTKLYILGAHARVLHSGVKATITELRSHFWLVKGRSTVKKIIRECVLCKKHEGQAYKVPPQPPLPSFRVQEAPPFTHTDVDYAGPLYVKQPGSQQAKVWIALYTCCVTRAVHLDLAPDMTANAFIRSFKRFSARRGLPLSMISDNGRTFEAAAKKIESVFSSQEVKQHLEHQGIKWRFNAPRAPWWGGLFERLVRSTKRCLRKILGQAKLSYEELLTALAEVINSRPLTCVSAEDLEEPLTPSHLMYGRRIMNLPDHLLDDREDEIDSQALNSRVKYLNRTLDSFWKRWRKEYLLELREAHCHYRSSGTPQIVVGDVVVVHAENQPRSQWKLGVIKQLLTEADGEVRAASVRVTNDGQSSTLCRPIQHLYPLEVRDSQDQDAIRANTSDPEPNNDPDTVDTSDSERTRRAAAIRARDRIFVQAISEQD